MMSGTVRTTDLNCDLGEGAAHDAELMPLISSANVCCGVHAGSFDLMAETVALAIRHGVAIGAHPGHPDPAHFGRRELAIEPAACAALVASQVAVVAAVAGPALRHVKLHGGLYHQVGRDPALANAVATMLAERWPRLVVYAMVGTALVAAARARGLVVAEEAFIDRGYAADGALVPRAAVGGVVDDPAAVAARAVRLVTAGTVQTVDGREITVRADTLCIHGDAPAAVAIARATRTALHDQGIAIRPPA
jgi:UPF0271 protein